MIIVTKHEQEDLLMVAPVIYFGIHMVVLELIILMALDRIPTVEQELQTV